MSVRIEPPTILLVAKIYTAGVRPFPHSDGYNYVFELVEWATRLFPNDLVQLSSISV